MERTYWPAWEKYLRRNGLIPLVSELLLNARSLVVVLSQLIVLGTPFFRYLLDRGEFLALVETLGDVDKIDTFSDYLLEAGG
jgi:hypothetical protein